MNVAQGRLNYEQYHWINHWLERWGAWVHSGRLDKPQNNLLAYFMATITPQAPHTRPMCNDDDGLLISRVVDTVIAADNPAFGILLSYYAQGLSKRTIAAYYQKCAPPRKMSGRGGDRIKKPSLMTCRREVDDLLEAALWRLYQPLQYAFICRKPVANIRKIA